MSKTAVVLLNLGGPNSPEEIQPFLFSLFSDPAIIGLPQPFRGFLARFISSRRTPEASEIYGHLGGRSPLLANTQAQASALEARLGSGYRVFVAMRHGAPRTEEAVRLVEEYSPDRVILLPLYPQLSTTTTSSSFSEWHRLYRGQAPVDEICCYPNARGFIKAYAELILRSYQRAEKYGKPRVLLTAHGLPQKTIKRGDPYQFQVEQTAAEIIKACGVQDMDVVVCYQSRVGPLKWIEPYTDVEIKRAAQEGKPLVIAPISFVSEHSETLVELDIEYKELADNHGCPAYERVPAVGTHPGFIGALAELVLSPVSQPRVCPGTCAKCPNKLEKKVA
jgi:ferrochelatase